MQPALRISALALTFGALIICAAANGESRVLAHELDAYLLSQADRGFSGSVLVALGNEVVLAKGYGYANAEWKAPNSAQTRFRIASLTKSFTATAIMLLHEQRKLDLDDGICKYVESCPESWRPITIRHLLSNSSGIPNYFSGREPERHSSVTRAQILDPLRGKPLQFSPGTRFEYGNSAWFLLGIVIEKITGSTYEHAMQDLIFTPLAMTDTGQDDRGRILERRASGYTFSGDREPLRNAAYTDVSWVVAAASMYSTVEDLYKFTRALAESRLMSVASRSMMWTSRELPWKTDRGHYGYGWWVLAKSDAYALPIVRGSGGMDAFMSSLTYFPQQDVTIIVLVNSPGVDIPVPVELEKRVLRARKSAS
jgi:CubicO group peptidase (beta-lactamase class C family)